MKYLIVQDWKPTHGNHAGMVHMCQMLVDRYPDQYQMFVKEEPVCPPKRKGLLSIYDKACKVLRYDNDSNPVNHYLSDTFYKEYLELCKPMFEKLKDSDEIFLLEYLTPDAPQLKLAKYIREHFPKVKIYALSHLTVIDQKHYSLGRGNVAMKWTEPIDKVLTLGSSLSNYFQGCGINSDKISTGFHYVDSSYYHKSEKLLNHRPLTIIAMGAMKRNYPLLSQIVKDCSQVHWIICRGRNKDVDSLFAETGNVDLKGFLSEDELRHQMDISDISINIMEDTIGSNVVTTSMAMGLAMVASDVGSIRDYCTEANTIFCENTPKSFIKAISTLVNDDEKVLKMKKASIELSKRLTIENINNWFNSL